jgi:hypothetical protein
MGVATEDSVGVARTLIRQAAFFALLAALALSVFVRAIRFPFVFDAFGYLGGTLHGGWAWAWSTWDPGRIIYRPVLVIWFGVLRPLFGVHPLRSGLDSERGNVPGAIRG